MCCDVDKQQRETGERRDRREVREIIPLKGGELCRFLDSSEITRRMIVVLEEAWKTGVQVATSPVKGRSGVSQSTG